MARSELYNGYSPAKDCCNKGWPIADFDFAGLLRGCALVIGVVFVLFGVLELLEINV